MKRGEMTIGQIAKLILAVVVVVLLLFLAIKLFSPVFDKGDETAKSYLESLKREVALADSEEGGEFFMWYLGDSGKEFYLVYFGETIRVDLVKMKFIPGIPSQEKDVKVSFNSFGMKDNRICICIVEGYKSNCNYCEDLDYPVSFAGKEEEIWYEESGKRIGIKLEGKRYVFEEI